MSTEANVQTVKDFFAALRDGDEQRVLALAADDIEWIIPGHGWALAGTHRGHNALTALLQRASETIEMSYPKPLEFVAQGDRVMVIGLAQGTIKATATPFRDHFVFAMTVHAGRVATIREYIDTQALAQASLPAASPRQ